MLEGRVIVGHNLAYDLYILKRTGYITHFPDKIWDTMITYKNLYNLTSILKLKELGMILFGIKNTKELMIKQWMQNHKGATYECIPLDIMIPYAVEDIKLTSLLYDYELSEMSKRNTIDGIKKNQDTYIERDNKIVIVAMAMKEQGIKIDMPLCMQMYDEATIHIEAERETIRDFFYDLNPRSPSDIIEYCKTNNIPINTWTDQGNPKIDQTAIQEIAKSHSEFYCIDAYRKYDRIATTLSSLIDKQINGYIHTDFNVGFSVAGRFSSSNPNLQNVSKEMIIRDNIIDLRKIFIPEKDFMFMFIDYSQMELRLFADYANCSRMKQAFKNNKDLHTLTASIIYNKSEISNKERSDGKCLNFGLLYGMGYKKFAKAVACSEEKAKRFLNSYYNGYPELIAIRSKLASVINKRKGVLWNKGYIKNASGRVLFVEYNYRALNFLIQSTGADIIKQKMIEIHEFLKPYKSKLIMTIHDELGIHLHQSEMFLIPLIKTIMETPLFGLSAIPTEVKLYKERWSSK